MADTSKQAVVQVEHVSKVFGGGPARVDALIDINMDVFPGQVVGLMGPSGSGKTTLLNCIACIMTPSGGRLTLDCETVYDENWLRADLRKLRLEKVGFIFQQANLLPFLNATDNVAVVVQLAGYSAKAAQTRAVELLDYLEVGKRRHAMPAQLSGGEAQRVAIARALLRSPELVLMDEPLASLDRARRDEILPFLDRLHAESSMPILYVSHVIDEICRVCDHLLVMESGRVVADGELQSVLVRTDLPLLAGEDAGSVIECRVAGYDAQDELLRLCTSGGELLVPGRPREQGAPLRLRIRANDVSICRARPEASTILNILPAVVESIQPGEGSSGLVRLALGEDRVVARVTRRSIRELALAPGDRVFAQIKSVAMRSRAGR